MTIPPKYPQDLLETEGLEKGELVELRVLMTSGDFKYVHHLKEKNNVSETELRAVGHILVQSLRSFCE